MVFMYTEDCCAWCLRILGTAVRGGNVYGGLLRVVFTYRTCMAVKGNDAWVSRVSDEAV